jgi:hypothetical protein
VMGYLKQSHVVTLSPSNKTLDNGVYPDPANHVTAKAFLMEDVAPTLDSVLN